MMRRELRLLPMVLLVLCGGVMGQSLGDVARQNRQKEKTQAKPAKRVVTNEDIPESPAPVASQPDSAATAQGTSPAANSPTPKTAREWRMAILAQNDRIETMQAQIVKLAESIHFVTANAYVNGAEYNQFQVKKQQEVKNLQKQLEEEQKKLTVMQLAARAEGMGAAVYDP